MLYINYASIFKDVILNAVSLYFFAYLILYQRYGNKELFVTCSLFNISLLLVVMAIVRSDFNLAVGFGLFALLSLITVRSVPFTKTEMAYFFSVIALAVINGSGIADYMFVIICNVMIVGTAWTIALTVTHSANVSGNSEPIILNLDRVDSDASANPSRMVAKLQRLLQTEVYSYRTLKIDLVRDTMALEIYTDQDHTALTDTNEIRQKVVTPQRAL